MQYYTIDDLRRSPDQSGRSGWSMERFGTLEEALARYRALPASGARSVGLTDGLHVLELARRAVLFPAESPCEDVQAASPEALPLWANRPEAIAAARAAVSALHLRYRISGRMAVPVPPAGKPGGAAGQVPVAERRKRTGDRAPLGLSRRRRLDAAGFPAAMEPRRPSPGTPVPGGRDHGAGRVSPSGDHTLGIRILDAPHPGAAGKGALI